MSFYGFNRSALNGGVSGIIAGAALVIAVSSFVAEGTRVVLPSAAPTVVSTAQAVGLRTTFGDGGFITTSSVTAFPALLQLQTADIVVTSGLVATPTDAWGYSTGDLAGTGFIIRPGAGVSLCVSAVSAEPLVTVGYASNIYATSTTTADASVKLNGQSTTQRDGYVQQMDVVSALTADGLRTALGYATAQTSSDCTTDSIKTHGGEAVIEAAWTVSAIASTDAAEIQCTSSMTAEPTLIQHGEVVNGCLVVLVVEPTLTTFAAQVDLVTVSSITADARVALLGLVTIATTSSMVVDAEIYKPGESAVVCESSLIAQWGILISSSAYITASSVITAFAATNAEAPDPAERTMYRTATDRTMYRPFTDREMRRAA